MEFLVVLTLVLVISAGILLYEFFSGALIGADDDWKMVRRRRDHHQLH